MVVVSLSRLEMYLSNIKMFSIGDTNFKRFYLRNIASDGHIGQGMVSVTVRDFQ